MKNRVLLLKLLIILFFILFRLNIPGTYAKFSSSVNTSAKGTIAFYVIDSNYQSLEISLDKLVPSESTYKYDFSVANYDGTKRLETNAEYHIVIRSTTNLNLEIDLLNINNESLIMTNDIIQDEDGTFYNLLKTDKKYFGFIENQIDYYTLTINFPIEYSSYQYQDIIDSLEIIILSSQIID